MGRVGYAPRFTNSDAEWVARVGAALPDPGIDPTALTDLLALARGYRAANEGGDDKELALLDNKGGVVHFVGWAEYHRLMKPGVAYAKYRRVMDRVMNSGEED